MTLSLLQSVGLFLFIAGFILGLGAVSVIDMLGFLGRRSVYWTQATIRTHKVTKPFIWLGISLAILGGALFYPGNRESIVPFIHAGLALILIINGCFLSFYVSPFLLRKEKVEGNTITLLPQSLQYKITASFIISFLGWWTSVLLFVAYLSHMV